MANKDWIDFGSVAHGKCNMQSQYCSRYVGGRHTSPDMSAGLRFRSRHASCDTHDAKVDPLDYHDIQIHVDDVEEFAKRVNDYRRATHQIA